MSVSLYTWAHTPVSDHELMTSHGKVGPSHAKTVKPQFFFYIICSLFAISPQKDVKGFHRNCLTETVLMITHNESFVKNISDLLYNLESATFI